MPRARKTQKPVTAPGQQYGQNVSQTQAMQAMPLPDARGQATLAQNAAPPAAGQVAGQQPPDVMGQALAAARQSAPATGVINQFVGHDEPVTTGLPVGPGAGPEVLAPAPGSGSLFMAVAQATGDPYFLKLAARARTS